MLVPAAGSSRTSMVQLRGSWKCALLAALLVLSLQSNVAYVSWTPSVPPLTNTPLIERVRRPRAPVEWKLARRSLPVPLCRCSRNKAAISCVLDPQNGPLRGSAVWAALGAWTSAPGKGFAKAQGMHPPSRASQRLGRRQGAELQTGRTGALSGLCVVRSGSEQEAAFLTDDSMPDSDDLPILQIHIRKVTRKKDQKRGGAILELHPAEKVAEASSGVKLEEQSLTSTLRRLVSDDSRSAQEQTLWFRAKTEELAIRRHMKEPLRPGQPVYCADDNGRLVRGNLLSLDRAKNRLMVGHVRLHEPWAALESNSTIKTFLLPAIFPIGGCNGGLESELEKFVNFNTELDLCGAVGFSGALAKFARAHKDGGRGSVLGLLTAGRAPAVDDALFYIEEQKLRLMHMPFREHVLEFEAGRLAAAREELQRTLIDSETRLLRLCEVLAQTLFRQGGTADIPFFRSTGVECEVRG